MSVQKMNFVHSSGAPAPKKLKAFMRKLKERTISAELQLTTETVKLSKLAGKFMAQRVMSETKRKKASTGKLAESLLHYPIKMRRNKRGSFTIYIGDKSLMPVYWAMINYGGFVSPESVYGFWDDNSNGRSERSKRGGKGQGKFRAASNGEYGLKMTPASPIKGKHYIAYAHVRMLAYAKTRFNIFKKGGKL